MIQPLRARSASLLPLLIFVGLTTSPGASALTFAPVYAFDPNANVSADAQQQYQQASTAALNTFATFFGPSDITLRVNITFKDLGNQGTLGQAGPASFQPINGVYYAQALYNFITKSDTGGAATTMNVEMNTNASVNWNFSNTTPARGQYSFQDVIMHEVGHSMGFFDTVEKNGAFNNAGPGIFETLSLFNGTPLSNLDQATREQAIISNSLFWNGQYATAANGSAMLKLYAPNPYEQGSTYSHLDPSQTTAGGIFFPALADATYFPGPTRQELGMFRDIGWATTGAPTPTPAPSATPIATPALAQFVNISTRVVVNTGDQVAIGGFILRGDTPKKVIVRGIGPSLANAGVSGALQDPLLEIHGQANELIVSNDNWRTLQESEIAATGVAPTDNRESAVIVQLEPGKSYTAIIKGTGGTTGIGLIEVYDLQINSGSDLANISTRGIVLTDNNVLIGGFIVQGATPQRIVFRAIGPSLANAGITGALQDPTIQLNDANGNLLSSNDDWKDTQATDITATGIPPSGDRESAIVGTYGVGRYTLVVRGKGGTTGVALVEAYNLRPAKQSSGSTQTAESAKEDLPPIRNVPLKVFKALRK